MPRARNIDETVLRFLAIVFTFYLVGYIMLTIYVVIFDGDILDLVFPYM